jgi:DNA processing protein
MNDVTNLPEEAFAAALAGLERMSLTRLRALLERASPSVAVQSITGALQPPPEIASILATDGLTDAWRRSLVSRPPDRVWADCLAAGIDVFVRGRAGYPPLLAHDPASPPVLFVRGGLDRLGGRRVGIVGTRNATGVGRDIASSLGRDLAGAGISVVSGLARGIDGCAHRGAVSVDGGGPPIGVVGTGLDVVYPAEHRALWQTVAERGALLSESPPGTGPDAWRFPLRNRVLAALSEVVVVVESRVTGGSLITAAEARDRDIPVLVVPGSPRNPSAAGTNDLARDGCAIVTCVDDVLVALGLNTARARPIADDPRPRPDGADRDTLAVCAEPRTLDQVMLATRRTLVECALSLARLEESGWLRQVNGWYEQASAAEWRR